MKAINFILLIFFISFSFVAVQNVFCAGYSSSTLIESVKNADYNLLVKCLNAKISPNSKDSNDNSALILAINKGFVKGSELLIKNGANVNVSYSRGGMNSLMLAINKDMESIAELLIDYGVDFNLQLSANGLTPLMMASEKGMIEIVKYMIKYGVDINAKTNEGITASTLAMRAGNFDIVKLLNKAGAVPGTLTEAVITSDIRLASKFIGYGADINEKSSFDKTPLAIAFDYGNLDRKSVV